MVVVEAVGVSARGGEDGRKVVTAIEAALYLLPTALRVVGE